MSKGVNQALYRNEIQVIKAHRKIVPMPGMFGKFVFNVHDGVTVSDGLDKLIWGIGADEEYNFARALHAVRKDFKQIFTDNSLGSIGKKTHVEFELMLNNGNHTREVYEIIGHKEDYDITSQPVFINGTTTLLKEAV